MSFPQGVIVTFAVIIVVTTGFQKGSEGLDTKVRAPNGVGVGDRAPGGAASPRRPRGPGEVSGAGPPHPRDAPANQAALRPRLAQPLPPALAFAAAAAASSSRASQPAAARRCPPCPSRPHGAPGLLQRRWLRPLLGTCLAAAGAAWGRRRGAGGRPAGGGEAPGWAGRARSPGSTVSPSASFPALLPAWAGGALPTPPAAGPSGVPLMGAGEETWVTWLQGGRALGRACKCLALGLLGKGEGPEAGGGG